MSFNTPNLEYQGNPDLSIENYGEIVINKIGISTGACRFKCQQSKFATAQPKINSAHPLASYMICTRVKIRFQAGVALFDCDYEGTNLSNSFSDPSVVVYELVIGSGEEAIETHPNFVAFGGTPHNPLNGAVFEDVSQANQGKLYSSDTPAPSGYKLAIFKHFLITADGSTANRFAGVSKYLESSQITWRQQFVMKLSSYAIGALDTIQTPPGPVPNVSGLGGTRNWLYIGASQTQRGGAFSVTQEWRLSGRRGWDALIYPSS